MMIGTRETNYSIEMVRHKDVEKKEKAHTNLVGDNQLALFTTIQ